MIQKIFTILVYDLRRNKFTILEVEAPGRQDAEAQEYQAYFELPQHSWTGWIDVKNMKLFLSDSLVLQS